MKPIDEPEVIRAKQCARREEGIAMLMAEGASRAMAERLQDEADRDALLAVQAARIWRELFDELSGPRE